MAFFNATMVNDQVHVLLVGNEVVSLLDTSKLLEFNSYQVTAVTSAAIASTMLAKEKVNYDVVMVDVSSSDAQGYQLAHKAISMGYMVILMADNPNVALIKCAIEDGAFMFIPKPATMDVMKYLWQHVLREKTRETKENAKFMEMISSMEMSNFILNSGRNMVFPCSDIGANMIHVQEPAGPINTVYRNVSEEDDTVDHKGKKPKICMDWNQELHEKFVEAVRELGDGRCYPRDILELMNVPGLKRLQVASHLQKCRQGWKPQLERRHDGASVSTRSSDSNGNSKPRRHGSYPRVAKGVQPRFLFRDKGKDEQAPRTHVVENSIGPLEPDMRQKIEVPEHNVSNDIANMNEIPGDNMVNGENVVSESNHEGGWTIPFDDSWDFAGLDNFDGVNQMDDNFEGFDLDQFFSLNPGEADEDPESFWRSFLSK